MQDPLLPPWGAQDRFQAHFIVKLDVDSPSKYLARTILKTYGHFGAKKVESVSWNGGLIADHLDRKSTRLNFSHT